MSTFSYNFDWKRKSQSFQGSISSEFSSIFQRIRSHSNALSYQKRDNTYKTLKVIDTAICLTLVAPVCIAFWGSCWYLLNHYIIPSDDLSSALVSLAFGALSKILVYCLYPIFEKKIQVNYGFVHLFASRFFIILYNIGEVNFWRGGFNIMDKYTGPDWKDALIVFFMSYITLLLLKGTANMVSTPLGLKIDLANEFYHTRPYLRTPPRKKFLYLVDSMFSILVISSLSVICWRNCWNVIDHIIDPDNQLKSLELSLIAGYLFALIIALTQVPISRGIRKIFDAHPLLSDNIEIGFTFFKFLSSLIIWRGLWTLLNSYILLKLSYSWYVLLGATLALIFLQMGSNIAHPVVYIDGESPFGEGITLKIKFLQNIFNKREPLPHMNIQSYITHNDERHIIPKRLRSECTPEFDDDTIYEEDETPPSNGIYTSVESNRLIINYENNVAIHDGEMVYY